MNSLEYFVGKICTVFTVPTNRDFKSENPATFPQPVFHYFVGKVLEVNHRGVWMEQWNNEKKLRSFFFMDHIVSMSEEEILDPSNPADMKAIEEYRKAGDPPARKPKPESPYIDVGSLSGIVEKARG